MAPKRFGPRFVLAALFAIASATVAHAQIWYPAPYPPPYYRYNVDLIASVRLEVTPKEAEVFVDGYYAGIVDDFDGFFQRLHTTPGQHDITLYRDGYRTATQHLYLTADGTFRIKYTMERLAPGEVAEARPVPPPVAQNTPPLQRGPLGRPVPPRNAPPPGPPGPPPGPPPGRQGTGTISIRVQPADAELLIDGQPSRSSPGLERTIIDVSAGRHNVQAHRDGYVGYLTDVDVRPGETTALDINLRRP